MEGQMNIWTDGKTKTIYPSANFVVCRGIIKTPNGDTLIKWNIFSGVCEDYGIQGDSCSQMAVMNGHCGCAPGLVCGGLVWIIDRPGSRFVGRGLNPTLYPGQDLTRRCGIKTLYGLPIETVHSISDIAPKRIPKDF